MPETGSSPSRYAVYYAPPPGSDLASFGAAWLSPRERRAPAWGLDEELWFRATKSPAHYGFHGTMKAPFRLAEGQSEALLMQAMAEFAARERSFEAPPLQLERLGGYLALTLSAPSPEMDALHERCIERFEPFRAPLNAQEMQKRLSAGLSARRLELLKTYGYPDVLDQFTFHLTLAGPVHDHALQEITPVLAEKAAPLTAGQVRIGDICLFRQLDRDSPFDELGRFSFGDR